MFPAVTLRSSEMKLFAFNTTIFLIWFQVLEGLSPELKVQLGLEDKTNFRFAGNNWPHRDRGSSSEAWFIPGASGLVHTGCIRLGSYRVHQAWFIPGASGLVHTGCIRLGSYRVHQAWFALETSCFASPNKTMGAASLRTCAEMCLSLDALCVAFLHKSMGATPKVIMLEAKHLARCVSAHSPSAQPVALVPRRRALRFDREARFLRFSVSEERTSPGDFKSRLSVTFPASTVDCQMSPFEKK